MNFAEMKKRLLELAEASFQHGPGYAQEAVVLREAADQLGIESDRKQQQVLLTAWHDLFREGALSWGYDIDNPGSPFFHLSRR